MAERGGFAVSFDTAPCRMTWRTIYSSLGIIMFRQSRICWRSNRFPSVVFKKLSLRLASDSKE